MFGAKTKREIQASGMSGTPTMSAVNQKIDSLQSTLDAEQQANGAESSAEPRDILQNLIGKGTIIEGNVQAVGDLIIDGTIKGDVTTKTKLVAGPTAIIEGNILAQHAEIAGRVQGTVKALGLLVINSSGTILGDVITKDLNVESGSTFNGRLQVGGNISATPVESVKVVVKPAAAVTDSVFDSPAAKKPTDAVSGKSESSDKTAEQLAANLAKSALLH